MALVSGHNLWFQRDEVSVSNSETMTFDIMLCLVDCTK